jgi:hypothetical protein
MTRERDSFKEEMSMSGKIDPEAAVPTTIQSYEMSDRNPVVAEWGEGGGVMASPGTAAQRVTPGSPAVPANAGLTNYDVGDTGD